MEPLTPNDDDLLVYCDWLEDEGRSEEAKELREEIINPNVESWYWEYSKSGSQTGSGGSGRVGGSGIIRVGVTGCGFRDVGSGVDVGGSNGGAAEEAGGRGH